MDKFTIAFAIAGAIALVAFGVVAAAVRPRVEQPHLTSMTDSAAAMLRDGGAMRLHGQAMLEEGRRTGDQDLVAQGEHWLRDGDELIRRAQWMTMDPLAPGNLVTPPSELSRQGSWGDLTSTAAAMLHDPGRAPRAVDLQALRWNGQAMQAEGRTMAEHGRVMAEEVETMVARHSLDQQAATSLRQAAQTMREVGGHLAQNGQAMIDYADRLRQSMGYR